MTLLFRTLKLNLGYSFCHKSLYIVVSESYQEKNILSRVWTWAKKTTGCSFRAQHFYRSLLGLHGERGVGRKWYLSLSFQRIAYFATLYRQEPVCGKFIIMQGFLFIVIHVNCLQQRYICFCLIKMFTLTQRFIYHRKYLIFSYQQFHFHTPDGPYIQIL